MKKYFAYALVSFVMCAMLCGCGSDRVVDNNIMSSPIIDTEMDTNDGIVNDRDGIIDDGKEETQKDRNDSMGGNGAGKASPSPEATVKP